MFQALIDALRTPDLRNKILFTLGMILVFRFLAHVPLPGVNQDQLNVLLQSSAFVNLLDLFSGGGLARFSIVALGVNPYINASIIMTLLNQTIPALERGDRLVEERHDDRRVDVGVHAEGDDREPR